MIFFKNSLWVSLFIGLFIPSLHAQWSGADPIWRQALGGKVLGAPTAQVESVAAACDGGSVQVYGRQGKLLWKYTAPGRLSPFISRSREGTSYLCRTNGTFIAVNRSGRELWRTNMGAPLTAPVLVGWDGRVFVPTAKRILCYTAAGYVLWSQSLPRPLAMAPAPDKQGGLVMVLDNGELFGLDPFGQPYSRKLPSLPGTG
jgi:outer membrane protein assembly factor BamB